MTSAYRISRFANHLDVCFTAPVTPFRLFDVATEVLSAHGPTQGLDLLVHFDDAPKLDGFDVDYWEKLAAPDVPRNALRSAWVSDHAHTHYAARMFDSLLSRNGESAIRVFGTGNEARQWLELPSELTV